MADEVPESTAVKAADPGSPRAKRARAREAENAIQAGRAPKRARGPASAQAIESAPTPEDAKPSPRISRVDDDPWTVPQSVRDRFVQEGHRFYFPDGRPAFRDLGRRLTTTSENTQLVHSLIEIARERGWTEITVTGTERFREEAWRQGRLAGLNVRGFRPSDAQQAQLVRALARGLAGAGQRTDSVAQNASAPPRLIEPAQPQPDVPIERIAGKLLDHGRDTYRHDPDAEPSYFVQLRTREGRREIWGKDIERAISKSLTQPQLGDEVILQRTGSEPVTATRRERDPEGGFQDKSVETHRNRWSLEKRSFFDERAAAAEVVRNEAVSASQAVREHPELAGTYLSLRAAELAAQALRDSEDRRRFVRQVRRALADDIQRGEALVPVRLRDRSRDVSQATGGRPADLAGRSHENPERVL